MADGDNSFLKGFLLGGILGSVVGLLLAPKTGKELREDIIGESDELLGKAKKDFDLARKAALHSYETGRDKVLNKIRDKKGESTGSEPAESSTAKQKSGSKKTSKGADTKTKKSSKSK